MTSQATADLRARLNELSKRIEEHRHHSAASSGTPFGGVRWSDIVETHGKLSSHMAEERRHDATSIERVRADVEALSLSLDGWLKGIDSHFGTKGGSGA